MYCTVHTLAPELVLPTGSPCMSMLIVLMYVMRTKYGSFLNYSRFAEGSLVGVANGRRFCKEYESSVRRIHTYTMYYHHISSTPTSYSRH